MSAGWLTTMAFVPCEILNSDTCEGRMIEIQNVTKVYRMGDVEVRALNGVSLA